MAWSDYFTDIFGGQTGSPVAPAIPNPYYDRTAVLGATDRSGQMPDTGGPRNPPRGKGPARPVTRHSGIPALLLSPNAPAIPTTAPPMMDATNANQGPVLPEPTPATSMLNQLPIPALATQILPDPSGYPERWQADRRADEIMRQNENERQRKIAAGEPVPVPGDTFAQEQPRVQPIVDPNQPPPTPYGGPDLPAFARDIRKDQVVPPDPNNPDHPPVVPATDTQAPPPVDPSGLPGASTETATGALSLDAYIDKIKQAYPDLDFTNPKQAEADANARRDVDRTAMLAQLALAGGMLKGAGAQWQGIGEGFMSAEGIYDKGYQKYQQALQDSADRYGKQQEAQMTYDTARRKSALDLYTNAVTQDAETRRVLWKEKSTREWENYKLQTEGKRADVKETDENINKFFDDFSKQYKPPSDPSMMDPAELAKNEKINRQIMAAREASIRQHKIYMPEQLRNVADQ